MLGKVFFARKTNTSATLAVGVRALAQGFGATVLAMDFALVAEQTAWISEALDFLAARLIADIRAIMLIHVFTERSVLACFEAPM